MALDRFHDLAQQELDDLSAQGKRKSLEAVVERVIQPQGERGPRFVLRGDSATYLRMNANSYLGLGFHPQLIEADEAAVRAYGVGPGAVRFISGSYLPHVELEARLAQFHGREAAMIFSSAYATVLSVLSSLITPQTAVISDELNHNCIINAVKLSRPHSKAVYQHLDLGELDARLSGAKGAARALVVTDGIFSMRGAHAPLAEIAEICRAHDADFPEGVLLVVDDSHGVGAFGQTGRGTEEFTGRSGRRADRHAGQGLRRQRRLRHRQPRADRVPAREVAHLHLLQPDHGGRGGGGEGGRRPDRQRLGPRAAGASCERSPSSSAAA